MIKVKAVIVGMLFISLMGCSVPSVEPPMEQEQSGAKREEDRKSPSMPTFTYRPGAGLMIEGR